MEEVELESPQAEEALMRVGATPVWYTDVALILEGRPGINVSRYQFI